MYTIEAYLEKQTQQLVEQFKNDLQFLVAAKNKEELQKYATRINGELLHLNQYPEAVIIKTSERVELFLKAEVNKYRDVFKVYLAEYHDYTDTLPKEYHVDHLYNKKRFSGLYVRLILLPATINSSWGGLIEKPLTKLEEGKVRKEEYYMDYFIFLKAILFRAAKTTDRKSHEYIEEAVEKLTELELISNEADKIGMTAQLVAEFNFIEHGIWTNDENRLDEFLARKK